MQLSAGAAHACGCDAPSQRVGAGLNPYRDPREIWIALRSDGRRLGAQNSEAE